MQKYALASLLFAYAKSIVLKIAAAPIIRLYGPCHWMLCLVTLFVDILTQKIFIIRLILILKL